MPAFQWTQKATNAALALADGRTQLEAADIAGVNERTIRRWLALPEFSEEVDRLVFLTGIARKSERLKIAKRIARNLDDTTAKDLLDWLKFAQSETDGVKLDLAHLLKQLTESAPKPAHGPRLAGSRSDRDDDSAEDGDDAA
jgi:transcription initiation factor TFIIIB Brf1 subunit/transcription initiation factor TFIIB